MSSKKSYNRKYYLAKKLGVPISELDLRAAETASDFASAYVTLVRLSKLLYNLKQIGHPKISGLKSLEQHLPEILKHQKPNKPQTYTYRDIKPMSEKVLSYFEQLGCPTWEELEKRFDTLTNEEMSVWLYLKRNWLVVNWDHLNLSKYSHLSYTINPVSGMEEILEHLLYYHMDGNE